MSNSIFTQIVFFIFIATFSASPSYVEIETKGSTEDFTNFQGCGCNKKRTTYRTK